MKNLKLSTDSAPGIPAAPATPDLATQIGTDASAVIGAAAPFAPLAGPYGAAAVVIATGALAIYKAALPLIESAIAKGEVSPAVQAQVQAAFQDVAVTHATAFQGPEWKQD